MVVVRTLLLAEIQMGRAAKPVEFAAVQIVLLAVAKTCQAVEAVCCIGESQETNEMQLIMNSCLESSTNIMSNFKIEGSSKTLLSKNGESLWSQLKESDIRPSEIPSPEGSAFLANVISSNEIFGRMICEATKIIRTSPTSKTNWTSE